MVHSEARVVPSTSHTFQVLLKIHKSLIYNLTMHGEQVYYFLYKVFKMTVNSQIHDLRHYVNNLRKQACDAVVAFSLFVIAPWVMFYRDIIVACTIHWITSLFILLSQFNTTYICVKV